MMNKATSYNKNSKLLQQYIQEALAQMDNMVLCNLTISHVDGSKNKSDAKVYILPEDFDTIKVLGALKKAAHYIAQQALLISGWARFPKLKFYIDDSLDQQKKMEALFEQIKTSD